MGGKPDIVIFLAASLRYVVELKTTLGDTAVSGGTKWFKQRPTVRSWTSWV